VLAVVGTMKKAAVLVVSAVITAPFSLYLGGTPRVGWLGFMIPVLLLGAGVAIRNRRAAIAWLLVVPVVAVVGWVAILVMEQYG